MKDHAQHRSPEPGTTARATSGAAVYTCPMHPEVVRDKPGNCPICGMALEPRTATAGEEENPELRDMTRRFWVSALLSLPLLLIAMAPHLGWSPFERILSPGTLGA